MRLVGTLPDPEDARIFSQYLTSLNIQNFLEISRVEDWGSEACGTFNCQIWIHDEDSVKKVQDLLTEFKESTDRSRFRLKVAPLPEIPPLTSSPKKDLKNSLPFSFKGDLTLYLIALCVGVFMWGEITTPKLPPYIEKQVPLLPLISAPIKKAFLYDYPKPYTLIDKITRLYGVHVWQSPTEMPPEAAFFYKEALNTPIWPGVYPIVVESLEKDELLSFEEAPLFEKIEEGQAWRLFTPILLHNDLFHLFFNMIWLAALGRPLEKRAGRFKYLLLILISAAFSNTAQYLMSGANFIGYSGVLCAMMGFIFARQKRAPWEGYAVQPSVLYFMATFIIGMALLQGVFFVLEVASNTHFSFGIANTAHLSGAFIGFLLGLKK